MTEMCSTFDQQLHDIQRHLLRVAARVTETAMRGTEALLDLDLVAAQVRIDGDDEIDALSFDVEERCFAVRLHRHAMDVYGEGCRDAGVRGRARGDAAVRGAHALRGATRDAPSRTSSTSRGSATYNLLENAVNSDPGSTVQVRARTDGRWVKTIVEDHGVGIPWRDLDRVVERFDRVDRARSRQTGGTGLGLAMVRRVANNHAGEVREKSREGEGSTFTLRLPVRSGPIAITAEAG